ncbi:hypothetical protein MNBD_GAMMA16-1759 [hydrothermal vent metagenome]|uniref:Uncharacterized protein n=1 Tax=hydrothermal vent metagenome TaxID=652676 RepID=A0A3B0ZG54_9ZZZZ
MTYLNRLHYQLFIVAFIFVTLGTTNHVHAFGKRATPVIVVPAKMTDLAPVAWYSGSIFSRNEAMVAAEVSGRLIMVANVGKTIKKGQVLAKLDGTLAKLEVAEFKAEVQQEEAKRKFLAQEVARLKRLAKTNNAAQTLLEKTISERDTSRAELAVAKARLEQANFRLKRSVVRAPFNGTVVNQTLRMGEWVNSGNAVVYFVDTTSLELRARVSLSALQYLQVDDELLVKENKNQHHMVIHSLVPVGDPQSRLLELRLQGLFGNMAIGQAVRIAVPTAAARNVLAVPRDALVLRRAGSAVYVISDDNKAQRIAVQTGIASHALIEVSGNLKAGDQVVIRGGERLRPGQEVAIKKAAQP